MFQQLLIFARKLTDSAYLRLAEQQIRVNRLELGDGSFNERVGPVIRFTTSKELCVIKRQSNSPAGDVSVAEIRRL